MDIRNLLILQFSIILLNIPTLYSTDIEVIKFPEQYKHERPLEAIQDTTSQQIKLKKLEPIGCQVIIRKQVKKQRNECFIYIDDTPHSETRSILILVNGKKVENPFLNDLHPNMIKTMEILNKDDVPKRYRRKGIDGVIKISTKKKVKLSAN